jgi:hypothetical protein
MSAKKVSDVNKAELIRQYREDHPDAMPVEVVAALGKRGVAVDTAYVSTISHVEKKRQQKRIPVISTEALLETKEFINDVGSEEEAREMISRLERIGGLSTVREALDLITKISS